VRPFLRANQIDVLQQVSEKLIGEEDICDNPFINQKPISNGNIRKEVTPEVYWNVGIRSWRGRTSGIYRSLKSRRAAPWTGCQ
jgi:hypothetical protein